MKKSGIGKGESGIVEAADAVAGDDSRVPSADSRPTIHVACGVLQRASGEVLLAQRPDGKIAAGWWEFPGGKIEDGEAPRAALLRELEEELGVQIDDARPLIRYRHDYSNRTVMLDSWLVSGYSGALHGREGQALAWVAPERLHAWPRSLPTVAPSARALLLPNQYVFTPPAASVERIVHGLARLPPGCLLRLRLPALDEVAYREAARRLLPPARAQGLRVVLDRDPAEAQALGADGWHASEAAALRLGARAERGPALQLASCHDADSLRRVAAAGFDAAVLGTVRPSASHPGRAALGWDAFAAAAQYVGIPVYAIGGVGPADLGRAFDAYGQGVAGISAYWRD